MNNSHPNEQPKEDLIVLALESADPKQVLDQLASAHAHALHAQLASFEGEITEDYMQALCDKMDVVTKSKIDLALLDENRLDELLIAAVHLLATQHLAMQSIQAKVSIMQHEIQQLTLQKEVLMPQPPLTIVPKEGGQGE